MHVNVTAHPNAAWTLQQMRELVADTDDHRYLLHDRDSIFAKHLDDSIRAMGLAALRSPFASPKAKDCVAYCTSLVRSVGTCLRRRAKAESFRYVDA